MQVLIRGEVGLIGCKVHFGQTSLDLSIRSALLSVRTYLTSHLVPVGLTANLGRSKRSQAAPLDSLSPPSFAPPSLPPPNSWSETLQPSRLSDAGPESSDTNTSLAFRSLTSNMADPISVAAGALAFASALSVGVHAGVRLATNLRNADGEMKSLMTDAKVTSREAKRLQRGRQHAETHSRSKDWASWRREDTVRKYRASCRKVRTFIKDCRGNPVTWVIVGRRRVRKLLSEREYLAQQMDRMFTW